MAGQNDFLEMLLNTPKQRTEYVTSTKYDDPETGEIDLGALIEEVRTSTESTRREAAITEEAIAVENQVMTNASNDVLAAIQASVTARANKFSASSTALDNKAKVEELETADLLEGEAAIREVTNANTAYLTELDVRAKSVTQEMFEDLAIIDEGNATGFMDFIQNPINSIKAKINQAKAETRIGANKLELDIIADAGRTSVANYQAIHSNIGIETALRAENSEQSYFANTESANVLAQATNTGEFTDDILKSTFDVYNIQGQRRTQLRERLNDVLNHQNATVSMVNSIISGVREERSAEEHTYMMKEREKNEAIRTTLDTRFGQISQALDLPWKSFEEYVVARQGGLVTPEQQIQISNTMVNGLIGAEAITNSTNPLATFQSLTEVMGEGAVSPQFAGLIARADAIMVSNGIEENQINPNDSQRDIDEKRDRDLAHFFKVLPNDFGKLITTNNARIMSPHQMTFGAGGNVPNMPLDAAEELGKWNLSTSNMDTYISEALAYAKVSDTSISTLANSMAAIMKVQFESIKKDFGFTFPVMGTSKLGNSVSSVGDATNPAHWATAIELQRIELRARREDFAEQRADLTRRGGVPR